jgi:hypothetical protein
VSVDGNEQEGRVALSGVSEKKKKKKKKKKVLDVSNFAH